MYDMATRDTPKRPPKKQTPIRYGANLTVWIDPAIKAELVSLVETIEPKTTLTGIVELALKEFINRRKQK